MPEALPLGSTIGILGGGQLGRMLSLAASRLGFKTHIYCPDAQSPAFEVTPHKTVAVSPWTIEKSGVVAAKALSIRSIIRDVSIASD